MIAIMGAGSLGRLWAASLPAQSAAFVPRPGALPADPVRFDFQNLAGATLNVTVPWLTDWPKTELLLVMTKAGDTLNAITDVADKLPENAPVILFQNGLGSQQAVAERWPERPVLAASTTDGANRPSEHRVVHAGAGETWLGALTDAGQAQVQPVINRLRSSGLTLHPEPDILARLWQKLVINAGINPFTALLDCPNGDLLTEDLFLSHIDGLCTELAQLMTADGQGQVSPSDLRHRIETVARNTARNTSSMRADVQNRRRTEIDFINGYLVRLGQRLGIATPVNQLLAERVQQLSNHQQEHPHG